MVNLVWNKGRWSSSEIELEGQVGKITSGVIEGMR
jgi:hypothetical protein